MGGGGGALVLTCYVFGLYYTRISFVLVYPITCPLTQMRDTGIECIRKPSAEA
jgi:hypothetical protein